MLSRRSMIRALGFGVPAAAVAAAVELRKPAMSAGEAGLDVHFPAVAAATPETQAGFWLFDGEGNPVISTHEGQLVFHGEKFICGEINAAKIDVDGSSEIDGEFKGSAAEPLA